MTVEARQIRRRDRVYSSGTPIGSVCTLRRCGLWGEQAEVDGGGAPAPRPVMPNGSRSWIEGTASCGGRTRSSSRPRFSRRRRSTAAQIAPSTVRAHLSPRRTESARAVRDRQVLSESRTVHADNLGVYGVRKVHASLKRERMSVAECTVERLMKTVGL